MTDTVIEEATTPSPAADSGDARPPAPISASRARAVWRWVGRAVRSPWFAYAMVLALQLKVVWQMWSLRDMTSGDTSSYFGLAVDWYRRWRLDVAWSPLYLAFYGSLMHLTRDPFSVTILHRLLIVFASTAGVLTVLRRMLPHALALLAAAWWAVLPINYDTLYEVHLFSLLPVLVAWLVILRRPRTAAGGEWVRAVTLGLLVFTMFFVRNELFVAVACFTLVCLSYEIWRRRAAPRAGSPGSPDSILRDPQAGPWGPTLLRYTLPPLLAVLLILCAYERASKKFPELGPWMKVKHTLNMAQVYAFGYQQRHPEWAKSPWTDCGELCERDFGDPRPTLTMMLRRNPRATLRHFAWNVHLVPAGFQVLMFNCTSRTDNPDYAPVTVNPLVAGRLSLAAASVLLLGFVLLAFRWRYWWNYWLRDRAWGWAAMFSVAATIFLIIPTQRPRPSYLFSFSVLIMTLVGMCAFVILHTAASLPGLRRVAAKVPRALPLLMPLVMLGLVVVAPSYYIVHASDEQRKLLHTCRILEPYHAVMSPEGTIFIKGAYAGEVQNYLLVDAPNAIVKDYSVMDDLRPEENLAGFLDRQGAGLFFLDEVQWGELETKRPGVVQELIEHGDPAGWRLIGFEDAVDPKAWPPLYLSRWLLFQRAKPAPGGGFELMPTGLSAGRGRDLFGGWSAATGLGRLEGPYPAQKVPVVCWGYAPATVLTLAVNKPPDPTARPGETPQPAGAVRYKLVLSGRSGNPKQKLTVKLNGKVLGEYPWNTHDLFRDLTIPLELTPGTHQLELAYDVWENYYPPIKYAILFRKLQVLPD